MHISYYDLINSGNYVGKTKSNLEVWQLNRNFYLYNPYNENVEKIISNQWLKMFMENKDTRPLTNVT